MKFFITADIHGNISTWLTIQALMTKQDILVIAGDLFDTRYGRFGHPDFAPETIRQDLSSLPHKFYYVYGNCDIPSFFPGYDHSLHFSANSKNVFLHHGHYPVAIPSNADIIIQGHTHICSLEKKDHRIFMNPGSITRPKKGPATFGILEDGCIRIMDLHTGTPLLSMDL